MESKKQNQQNKLIDADHRLVVAREKSGVEMSEMDEGGQNVQTSSYKISKLWGCNVQHGDYSQ